MSVPNSFLTNRTAPRLAAALDIARRLGPIFPLCWPNEDGGCACPGEWVEEKGLCVPHEGHDVGKAPIGRLVPNGVKGATANTATIERWWDACPDANVGLALVRSGLLAVDPDSPAADAEARELGLPPTLVRISRNPAFLYRRPPDCPEENDIQTGSSGALDVLGRGYLVVEGRHASGHDVYLDGADEPVPSPGWAVEMLRLKAEERAAGDARRRERANGVAAGDEPPVRLQERGLARWRGELVERKADGNLDRSGSLFFIGLTLAEAGASEATIAAALEERDAALGWRKYADRGDAVIRYIEIAEKAITYATNDGPRIVLTNGRARAGGEEPADEAPRRLADVIKTFRSWLYLPDAGPLLVTLGAVAANLMEGDASWLLIVGGSGWGKTEILQAVSRLPNVHLASTITEAGLLSGTPKKEKAAGAKGGLLRTVGEFGILLCKDFTSVLSMNRDARASLLAALREIYDGSWTRHVGADGGRELSWSGKLGLIAGCTPTIDGHHAVVGTMGERFVYYRLPSMDPERQARQALARGGKEGRMRGELADAVVRLFAAADLPEAPPPLSDEETGRLVALATLAARCRSPVERDSHKREIDLIPDPEAPARLALVLSRLRAGMAAVGVDRGEAWRILVKVGLDCMPALRRSVFELLAKDVMTIGTAHRLDTTTIATAVGYPTTTARRALEDLAAHGVVTREAGGQGKPDRWALSDWARDHYARARGTFPEMSGRETTPPLFNYPQHVFDDFSGKVGAEPERGTSCWRCKRPVSTASDHPCAACGWLRCDCGACEPGCTGEEELPW